MSRQESVRFDPASSLFIGQVRGRWVQGTVHNDGTALCTAKIDHKIVSDSKKSASALLHRYAHCICRCVRTLYLHFSNTETDTISTPFIQYIKQADCLLDPPDLY